MSKADKMFEGLGYEKIREHEFEETKGDVATELILYKNDNGTSIEFWDDKTISKIDNYSMESYITIKELQALHKKCEELGWIK